MPKLIWVFAGRAHVILLNTLWSDWADAQADRSLRWAHVSFCWFCHAVAQMNLTFIILRGSPWDFACLLSSHSRPSDFHLRIYNVMLRLRSRWKRNTFDNWYYYSVTVNYFKLLFHIIIFFKATASTTLIPLSVCVYVFDKSFICNSKVALLMCSILFLFPESFQLTILERSAISPYSRPLHTQWQIILIKRWFLKVWYFCKSWWHLCYSTVGSRDLITWP